MQKLILTGLLFSFLLSACDGGRNIDVADRERRLGAPENQPAGGGVDPEIRVQNLSVSRAQLFEADKKVILMLSLAYFTKTQYKWQESTILVDLQTKVVSSYTESGLKTIATVECTSTVPTECKTFKFNESLVQFFPDLEEPTLQQQPFEVSAVSSVGDLVVQKKINDVWTGVGSASQIAFNTLYNFSVRAKNKPTKFYTFPSAEVPDQPTWLFISRKDMEIMIPFYSPLPGHRLMSVEDGNVESEVSFIATYLNMSNGQTLTQQYRVEHVQK
jgi:hypothetical protein